MSVRVVTSAADFATLRPAWERLRSRCAGPTVFLSHGWLEAAWQWQAPSAGLYLLCCERGGELVGALPLMRDRVAGGMLHPVTLEYLLVPDTQHCEILAAPEDAVAVAGALADALAARRRDWDVLRLRNLPPDGIATVSFAQALARHGARIHAQQATANPCIALTGTWDAYYASRSRRLKKANNLAANRLAKAGKVTIDWLEPGAGSAADVERLLEHVVRISARSWKAETGNSLDRPGPNAFIRRLTERAHAEGWLSIWMLSLDGCPVAVEYQLVSEGSVYALRSDFDASHETLSPGSHLSRQMLETYFDRGLTRYAMGPGDNAYKYRWADATVPVHALTAYGRTPRGRALATWELALKPALRRLRSRARPAAVTSGRTDDAD